MLKRWPERRWGSASLRMRTVASTCPSLTCGAPCWWSASSTLYADVRRGRRPSFTEAARPDHARRLVDEFVEAVEAQGVQVATGRFGAMMQVDLSNNGPFTLMVETSRGSSHLSIFRLRVHRA